ncbi:hypothetical protein BDB00DRAFT_872765 [Zychaea mexicana]|uniref:uncharacterized protein n=1 Tax=Zychaea mexicana TaxID=64656 RepID=UPI0022FF173D|nr:uncharacterized protein BDB00DRAFT_872765 [Zychaea mexicana]KAI9493045.1 hypothetical protein BDB00DRAFT_872765 [Zychaea mexicana]
MSYGVAFSDPGADCPNEYWFDGSVDIQLAANALERPIACYTSGPWAKYHPPSLTLPHSRHKQHWNEINPGHDHKTFWSDIGGDHHGT